MLYLNDSSKHFLLHPKRFFLITDNYSFGLPSDFKFEKLFKAELQKIPISYCASLTHVPEFRELHGAQSENALIDI
jgi:hypothetical protein